MSSYWQEIYKYERHQYDNPYSYGMEIRYFEGAYQINVHHRGWCASEPTLGEAVATLQRLLLEPRSEKAQ